LWQTVRVRCREQNLSLAELGSRAQHPSDNPHIRRSIPSRRLAAYAAVLEDPVLTRAASQDLYWDEIVAIEDIGLHQVFDLTVPDGSNFIANDICVHNTSMALGMAYGAAIGAGKTVGMFSLEMSAEQFVQRLLSMETGVDSHRLRLGQIDDGEWDRISRAFGRLAEANIFIDDTAGANVMDVRSKARRLQAEHGLDLVVIDYLQLMSARRTENRVQEISEISRGLKGLARELNVPVVALSQLSRAVESRADHKPMLSDLRESGSIEQDADIVLFIYREEKYEEDTEKKGIAEIIVAKHRNGPVGTINLRFFERTARFADLELYREPGA
jgi:replicative DNA helicase